MSKYVVALLAFATLGEIAYVAIYWYEATGPLAPVFAAHTASLQNGTIPLASMIDVFNDPWVKVAHFESVFYLVQTILDICMQLLITYVLIMYGVSDAIAERARRLSPNVHLSRSLYFLMMTGILAIISIPATFSGYILQTLRGTSFVAPEAIVFNFVQDLVIGAIITLISLVPLYWMIDKYKKWWWALAAFFFSLYSVFTIFIGPVFIDPLYFDQQPLDNETIEHAIADVVTSAGISPDMIFVTNASSATFEGNAWVSGLGSTARVLLDDTLIMFYSPAEIRSIVAHELGHYVLKHVWFNILAQIALTFITFFVMARGMQYAIGIFKSRTKARSISDVALYPVISLFLFLVPLLLAPAHSYMSRALEHQADVYGINATHDPQAAIDGFKRFAYQSFIDVSPPALYQIWFGTHPTTLERIRFFESQK